MITFVIFHGAFGDSGENWFPYLKENLEGMGQKVLIPQFPVESWAEMTKMGPEKSFHKQNLASWFETFEKYIDGFKADKVCFVGHSLGCLFILHAVRKYNLRVDSAIFVSPFLTKLHKSWQIDIVNRTFYKKDFDRGKLRDLIGISWVIYSDNDPYVDKNQPEIFAKNLNSIQIIL